MATHVIDVRPSYNAVVQITLNVINANGLNSKEGKNATKYLYDMAQILDTIHREKLLTRDMADVIEKNSTILKTIE